MGDVNCLRCKYRHTDNGNCTAVGGFCTAVPAAHCPLLREYLDTELTPEEVISMKFEWCAMMDALNSIGGGYTRLRELADADKDGRLVVLPCKVCDTVYLIVTKRARVYMPEFRFIKKSKLTFLNMERILQDFGKTVFLTREEAEKALEAMEDD